MAMEMGRELPGTGKAKAIELGLCLDVEMGWNHPRREQDWEQSHLLTAFQISLPHLGNFAHLSVCNSLFLTLVGLLTTNYHRLSGLNRNLFTHSSGGWKSQIEVWVGLLLFGGLFSWLLVNCVPSWPSRGLFFVPTCPCVYVSSAYKGTSPIQLGATQKTSL